MGRKKGLLREGEEALVKVITIQLKEGRKGSREEGFYQLIFQGKGIKVQIGAFPLFRNFLGPN